MISAAFFVATATTSGGLFSSTRDDVVAGLVTNEQCRLLHERKEYDESATARHVLVRVLDCTDPVTETQYFELQTNPSHCMTQSTPIRTIAYYNGDDAVEKCIDNGERSVLFSDSAQLIGSFAPGNSSFVVLFDTTSLRYSFFRLTHGSTRGSFSTNMHVNKEGFQPRGLRLPLDDAPPSPPSPPAPPPPPRPPMLPDLNEDDINPWCVAVAASSHSSPSSPPLSAQILSCNEDYDAFDSNYKLVLYTSENHCANDGLLSTGPRLFHEYDKYTDGLCEDGATWRRDSKISTEFEEESYSFIVFRLLTGDDAKFAYGKLYRLGAFDFELDVATSGGFVHTPPFVFTFVPPSLPPSPNPPPLLPPPPSPSSAGESEEQSWDWYHFFVAIGGGLTTLGSVLCCFRKVLAQGSVTIDEIVSTSGNAARATKNIRDAAPRKV